MNNDYLLKVLLDKIETLEKKVDELEKNQKNPTPSSDDWYVSFVDAVTVYTDALYSECKYDILKIIPEITYDLSDAQQMHVRVATRLMKNDPTHNHSSQVYRELKKATR